MLRAAATPAGPPRLCTNKGSRPQSAHRQWPSRLSETREQPLWILFCLGGRAHSCDHQCAASGPQACGRRDVETLAARRCLCAHVKRARGTAPQSPRQQTSSPTGSSASTHVGGCSADPRAAAAAPPEGARRLLRVNGRSGAWRWRRALLLSITTWSAPVPPWRPSDPPAPAGRVVTNLHRPRAPSAMETRSKEKALRSEGLLRLGTPSTAGARLPGSLRRYQRGR